MNTKNAFSTLLTVLITAVVVGVLTGVISYSYAVSKKDLEIEDLKDQLSQAKEEASVTESDNMTLETSGTDDQQPTTDDQRATATPSTTTDETTDWKTYANDKYGFSFKYPTIFILSNNESDLIKLVFKDDKDSYFDIGTLGAHGMQGYEKINSTKKDVNKINWDITYWTGAKDSNVFQGLENNRAITAGYYKQPSEYVIEAYYNLSNKDLFEQTFNQILSTFQFTE